MFEVLEADGVFTTTFTTVDSNGELATLTDGASPGISIKEMTSLTTAIGGDGTLFVEAYGEESAQTSYYIKDVGSVTGVHKLVVSCADLDAGSAYEVYLEDFSVDGVSVDNHKIPNIRFAVAPYGSSNVTHVNGTVVSDETDPVASIALIQAVIEKLDTILELDEGTIYKLTSASLVGIRTQLATELDTLATLLTMISDDAFTEAALANTPTTSVELTEEQISNLAAAVALLTKVVGQFG